MKNYDDHDLAELFAAMKPHNSAYHRVDFSVGVLCRAFGCMPADFERGKFLQRDHVVPQNPHLDPDNNQHAELIEAMGLRESDLTRAVCLLQQD